MRNQTKRVIVEAMKTKTEREMKELREKPNKIFKFIKSIKVDGKDVEGGKWIKIEMKELVSVKTIDVKYNGNICRGS